MADLTVRGGRSTSSQRVIIDGHDVTPSKDRRATQPSNDTLCSKSSNSKFSNDKFPQIITQEGLSSPSLVFEPQIKGGSITMRGSIETGGSLDSDCNTGIQLTDKTHLCLAISHQSYVIPNADSIMNRFGAIEDKDRANACSAITEAQAAIILKACSEQSHVKKQGTVWIVMPNGTTAFRNDSDYEQCIRENFTKLPRKMPSKDPVTRP